MKTFKRIFALCLVVGSFVVFSGFGTGDNNAAVVDKDFGCYVNWYMIPNDAGYMESIWTEETIIVANSGGNVMLSCQFHDVLPPDEIVKASGFSCGTQFGSTYDTKALVTTAGEGVLKCFIKKPKLID